MKFPFNLSNLFNYEVGIDLGTTKTIVYVKDKGIVLSQPTVVAINNKTNQIIAIGEEAYEMLGKTPPHISAIKPLTSGVVSDFEVAEKLLRYLLDQVKQKGGIFSVVNWPRLVISVPIGGTEVEKRAVEDAAKNAGARDVYLLEEPMAVALGARWPVQGSQGILVTDIGGGTTEVAVIALGGVVVSKSIRVAGNKLNEDIIYYIRDKYKLVIGEQTAEMLKIKIGSAIDLGTDQDLKIKGRDLTNGLPKEIKVKEPDIREAITPSLYKIVDTIRSTVEITPPELMGDVMNEGLLLSGGTSLLRGLDKFITENVGLNVRVAEEPPLAVIRGIANVLEDLESNKLLLTTISR